MGHVLPGAGEATTFPAESELISLEMLLLQLLLLLLLLVALEDVEEMGELLHELVEVLGELLLNCGDSF